LPTLERAFPPPPATLGILGHREGDRTSERRVEAKDIDFACWSCGAPFRRSLVQRHGWLVPRRRSDGGPYVLYDCPKCDRKSRVEKNRAGALLAGPIPPVPVVDAAFAKFDRDLARDLQAKKDWLAQRKGKRTWFFDVYEQELLAAGVRPGDWEDAADADPEGGADEGEGARRDRSRRAEPPPPPPKGERRRRRKPRPEPEPEPPPPPPPAREPTPYEVLGLEEGAAAEDVTRAFRDLAKRYHPDRFDALDEEFRALAHKKFLQLKAAYDALSGGGE
jgi:DnaJ-domain-containing protein 1